MEAELTRKDSAPEEISAEPLMGGGGGQITAGMGRREVGREEGALGLISGVVVLGLNCPYCTRNPPGPGMEPGSPALAGGFLTTGPSGRSLTLFLVYFYLPATSAGTWPIFSTP